MSRVITATGMALLSIGIVTAVHAKPASQAGQVKVDEAAQADGQTGNDDVATARGRGPKEKTKILVGRHRGGPKGGGRDKIDTGLTEAPSTDAARTGRPKERDKEVSTVTSRVSDPAASSDTTPVVKKRRGPKIKEKEATND